VELEFSAEVFYWRGPSPFYFLAVPARLCRDLRDVSGQVSYGWGMVPVTVTIGSTTWRTSLWPKDDGYVVPVKAVVRAAENLDEGSVPTVRLGIDLAVGP
jgi:hypothetical protein